MLTYRPLAEVEQQIQDQYAQVQLTAEGIEKTGQAVLEEITAQHDNLADGRQRQTTRLRQLDDERAKLLHAYYQGAVLPPDLGRRERRGGLGALRPVFGADDCPGRARHGVPRPHCGAERDHLTRQRRQRRQHRLL